MSETQGRQPPEGQGADWLNDTTDYQRCFVCGMRNPFGLHLHFRSEDGRIVTEFTGDERHQGFPGVVHGGILAALLDETMGRVPVLEHRWVMTGRLELRYRMPAPLGVPLRIVAEAIDLRRSMARIKGRIAHANDPAIVCCEAEGTFLPLPQEVRDKAIVDWPGLAEFFA